MSGHLRWLQKQFLGRAREERLAGPIYAAMVDHLFGTLIGFAALGATSVLLAAVTFAANPGLTTAVALLAMVAIACARAVLMVSYHQWNRRRSKSIHQVVNWELAYAILGIMMMLEIGSVCSYNVVREHSELAFTISIIIIMGISGCIAGRNGSRPRIVQFQLIAVLLPFVLALVIRGNKEAFSVLVLMLVFVFATMSSTKAMYLTLRSTLVAERQNRILAKGIKRSADLFDTALNNMTSGLLLFDGRRRLLVANEKVKDLLGRELVNGMMGRPTYEICRDLYCAFQSSPLEGERFTAKFRQIMDEGGEGTLTIEDHSRRFIFEMRLKVMNSGGVVFNIDDITVQHAKDLEIYNLAHNDSLTGLPNRVSLAHCLEERLTRITDGVVVLIYLDLDNFKDVNDELGHAAGDLVLVETAKRLASGIRHDDFLARIAGDEFVFVLSSRVDATSAKNLADRLIKALSIPFQIGSRQIIIGASAGLCIAGYGAGAAEEALRTADTALYEAKSLGKGRAIWFEPEMDDRLRTKREMIIELRHALDTGEGITLNYQPIVDARSADVVSCEALMRWTHKALGPIGPSVFIALAEESGLICTLGRWCLQRACEDALCWPHDIKVAVNVSGLQFQQGDFASVVEDVLNVTGLSASRLEIEITESVLANNLENMSSNLQDLVKKGVSIALDDFGTGFSSLSLLHKLPLDKIKIDQSFVSRLETDPSAVNLIASIVQMTQVMRKQVVVEGVETALQLAQITSAQGRLVQGYYFSRPLPQHLFTTYLEGKNSTRCDLPQNGLLVSKVGHSEKPAVSYGPRY